MNSVSVANLVEAINLTVYSGEEYLEEKQITTSDIYRPGLELTGYFEYYLEFDDARSGGFEPLKSVSGDKKVVLGLITTKSPKLEDKEDVIKRIHEAAKYVPLDRLYLSPQCGFASCEIGNKLTEEEQWKKLALVKEIAEEVWGEEK